MKSTAAILTVLFFICVFVIGTRYFRYRTITNVKPVYRIKDMPNLRESFCVSRASMNTSLLELDVSITLNGVPMILSKSYIAHGFVCRDILNTTSGQEFIVDQYFQAEYNVLKRDGHRHGIIKTLKDSPIDHGAYLCESSAGEQFSLVFIYQTYMYQTFTISLLHYPYDTQCTNLAQNRTTKGCGKVCSNRNCNSLIFHRSSLSVHPLLTVPLIGFSKDVIVMESTPEISSISILQQLVGLVTADRQGFA